MGSNRTLTVTFLGNTAGLESALKRSSAQMRTLQGTAQGLKSAGGSLTRNVTLPLIGLAAAAGKAAMDFDAAMERIHTQAGASQKAVGQLSNAVLKMAGQVGFAPRELADGMYHVVSSLNATLPPAKRISTELRVLRIAAEGAKVGNANLVDVTNALDAAVVSGIRGVQNYSQAMGALNSIVGAGDMTMQDLADALGTGLLAPMKRFGLSLKDVGGALAVFGDNNIRGQDAATKLTSAVRIMAAPSKAAAKELGGIGLTSLQLANDMRSGGLIKALTDLQGHLQRSGETASQQGLTISRAFGGRQSMGVQVLLGQLERLREKTNQVGTGARNFGRDWSATQKTAAQKTQDAVATMKADLIRFGNDVLPTLLSAGSTIVSDVDHVVRDFQKLPKGARDAILKGGLLLAGLGPAMKLLGVFTGGVGKLLTISRIAAQLAGFGKAGGALSGLSKVSQNVAEMNVGTLIAKTMVGGGPGGAGGGAGPATTVGEGAAGAGGVEAVTGAQRMARLTTGIAGASVLGVSGFAAMSKAQGTPLNKLNAFAHGVDPTGVLHLVGLPSVTDLLPAVKKRQALTPQNFLALSMGFDPAALHRIETGHGAPGLNMGSGYRGPYLTARGGPIPAGAHEAISQLTVDARSAKAAIDNLGKGSAATFKFLAFNAARANDVKFRFADTLGAELLKGHGVASRGIRRIVGEIDKLPPAAQADASRGMVEMTQALESKGAIAHGSTVKLRTEIVAEFAQMGAQVGHKADLMAAKIQSGSHQAASHAASNFANFQTAVGDAMASGVFSASQGAQLISKALNQTLKAFGAKQIAGVTTVTASSIAASTKSAAAGILKSVTGAARGGMFQFGQHGGKGVDNIPVDFGGNRIVVGSGELGVVLTGRQQAVANTMMAPIGGLPGLFSNYDTPHSLGGGAPAGYRRGGLVPSGVNFYGHPANVSPSVRQLIGTMEQHFPALAVTATTDGSHVAGSYHYRGEAVDMAADSPTMLAASQWIKATGVYRSLTEGIHNPNLAVKFGQLFSGAGPFGGVWAGHANHIHLAIAGALGPAAQAAAVAMLKTPRVSGHGAIATLVRAGLGLATKAANAYLSAHAPSSGGGSLGSSLSGFSGGGGSSAANQALGKRMMLAAGWPASEWPALLALWNQESGWSASADNPTSHAYGIPQSLPASKMASAGSDWQTNPATQIRWGLEYIRGRYGSPSAAEAHERSAGWYRRGGMLPFAGAFKDGGQVPGPAGRPAWALVHGGEEIVPAYTSGGIVGRLEKRAAMEAKLRRQAERDMNLLATLKQDLAHSSPKHRRTLQAQIEKVKQDLVRIGGDRDKIGSGGLLAKYAGALSVPIPSQGVLAQIQAAQLANTLTLAQNAGDIPGQKSALNAELGFENTWLAADKTQLAKVDRALKNRRLSPAQRSQLLQDKLSLTSEIGTIEGAIGSDTSTLSGLDSSGSGSGTDPTQALADATVAQTQAMAALQASLDQNTSYMKAVGAVETQQAIRALSDVISGQIFGRYLSRATGSAGDGSVARYGSVNRA